MLDIISENPYRILGVYSNSPMKERVENLGKIKAFLKVKKAVDFPTDMPSLLNGSPVRTEGAVADANAKLALPADQFQCAQFWFVKVTKFDDIALNNLLAGDVDKALSIWEKTEDASSLQNRIICNLILDNVSEAVACAEKLYTSYKNDFVKAVLGDNPPIDTNNVEYDFLDRLCEGLGVNGILPYVSSKDWKQHISGQAVKPLVDWLLNAVSVAKASKGNGPAARYKAGTKLMNDTKKPLAELAKLLNKTDLQYQMTADKVGLEILQCGIDYFNETNDADAPQKAMKLQSYAQSIVVGEMAKDRCRENVEVLKQLSQEYVVKVETDRIRANLDILDSAGSYGSRCNSIATVRSCVQACALDLEAVGTALGVRSQAYVNISSAIVGAALNAMVNLVNKATAVEPVDRTSVQNTLNMANSARAVMSELEHWTMNSATRDYFNSNRSSLENVITSANELLKLMKGGGGGGGGKGGNSGCLGIIITVVIIIILCAICS